MQFAILGSGSRGNATLIRYGKTCLMVDCGFSVKETESRLAKLAINAQDITAVLVTHEHSDHSKGVGALARKYQLPVWATRGTTSAARFGDLDSLNKLDTESTFDIQDLQVQTYPVPHDAREPCQFCFSDGKRRLAILTDSGNTTSHMEQLVSGADALLLECNHDSEMLWEGSYPQPLKQRVAGNFGHLSNNQAAEFLQKIDTTALKKLVAVHLSEKNNTEALARYAITDAIDCEPDWVQIAAQDDVFPWQKIL